MADATPHNVLILAAEDSLLPATRILTDSIVAPLRAAIPANLTIFSEFMDMSRGSSDDAMRETLRRLSARFADDEINLVFALGPPALELLLQHRDQLLPGVPIIFAGIRRGSPMLANLPAGVGGVTMDLRLARTINLATALQPDLKRIVLITGASDFDRAWHDRALAEIAAYERQYTIVDLAALPLDAVLNAVRNAQPQSAIVYLSMFKDGSGNTFVPADLTARISAAARAPVYGVYPTLLGKGIVGGNIATFDDAGAATAAMALPLLRGLLGPESLTIEDSDAIPQVDWRVLQRWDLDTDLLPVGTKILFQKPSLWVEHWPAALTGLLVIVGQAIIILAFWRQKRQRQKAEASLRQVNQHIEIAATTANLGLWSWCPARDSIWMTPRCRQMLGVAPNADIDLGLFLRSLAGRKQDMAKATLLESLRTGGIFQGEFRLTDGGNKRWLSATGHCIRNEQGRLVAGTIIDVTERKKAQIESEQQRQQLIHLTRVAVLGELSGALAHELNQPLTAILSNAQTAQRLIARPASDPAELQEILADIVQDDHRAGAVLSKLRTLIRKDEIHYAELDLNQIVDEVLNLVHSDLIERRIHVETDLGEGLPPARGDRVQIQQVLINLVRNACDAMAADPGQIHHLVLATSRHGNDGLAVTVADNGAGIPTDLRDRLFEPFVTTKSQGLGLGLTISRSILSAHGGKIWCESNPRGGAVFGFSLPIVERSIERGMAWAS
ncbi:MAG TPA: ATP-binding protein [Dongiaceae bacterium]|nr:ATP-binding protein [Dongiaceae bacterium]